MALLCVNRIKLAIIFGRFFPDPFKIDSAVQFGGVVFTPGDYLYADEDGIVVSARAL